MKKELKSETEYLYLLRILAIISVIFIHVSAQNWYSVDIATTKWKIFNFFDSIFRWGVPIFLMISGALNIKKEFDLKKTIRKILRIFTAFIIWSIIYYFVLYDNFEFNNFLNVSLHGHYHLWYCFLIIGIYLFLPILNKIAEDKKVLKYFLILTFFLSFGWPYLYYFGSKINNYYVVTILNAINSWMNNINSSIKVMYIFYFMLGNYLNRIEINKKQEWLIYILGIVGAILTYYFTLKLSFMDGKANGYFYDNFTLNVLLESIAVFVFIKKHHFCNKYIKKISSCVFGIYLSHALVIESLNKFFAVNTLSFNIYYSVPLLVIIVFIMSLAISYVINKIPFINKFMV